MGMGIEGVSVERERERDEREYMCECMQSNRCIKCMHDNT